MKRDQILFLISRVRYKASKFLAREMKAHHIIGLGVSHGEILGTLMYRGPSTMTEVARIIGKDKSTITALITKLIRMEYVEKRKGGADNRFSQIALTPKGKALKPAFFAIAEKLRATSYRGITDDERDQLVRLLAKLQENL